VGLGAVLAVLMAGVPLLYYRHGYTHSKRLRAVEPGVFYRSGCMTGAGLEEAIRTYGIKLVLNLQDEAPDPLLAENYWGTRHAKESEICRRNGAEMIFLGIDHVSPGQFPASRPKAIERFLEIMDDARARKLPVLVHCKAGLNRTGCIVAVYRMEYNGWSATEAMVELKRMGFGESTSTAANPYIAQYVLGYVPRANMTASARATSSPEARYAADAK
jgi:hypothetical protein